MQKTSIEWTKGENGEQGYTWNPTSGCTHVSDGCKHCYAETISRRFGRSQHPWIKPFEQENVKLHPERLAQPFKLTGRPYVFVDSMSDLFHALIPDEYIDQVFAVMAATPRVTYQILTKRPERMHAYLTEPRRLELIWNGARTVSERFDENLLLPDGLPLRNVWLGTSIEDQRVEERIEWLARTPAAVRFLSCEPLIGPLSLHRWMLGPCPSCGVPHMGYCEEPKPWPIHWVIVGGESGPHHRPLDLDWARLIRDQCVATKVPFFFKQVGGRTPKAGGRELDGRTWDEMPEVGG